MAPPQLFFKTKAIEKQLEDKEDVHVPEKKQEGNKEDVPEKKKEGNKEDVHEKKKEREAGMRDLVCMILVFVGLIMVIGGVSFNKNDLYAKKSKHGNFSRLISGMFNLPASTSLCLVFTCSQLALGCSALAKSFSSILTTSSID